MERFIFCHNPRCDAHFETDSQTVRVIRGGQDVELNRREYVIQVNGKTKNYQFCSTCIAPLEMIEDDIAEMKQHKE